jgi:hypothetical protein
VTLGPDRAREEFEGAVSHAERRRAGAFWTPEVVAERLLDAAGFDGDQRRVVDPACGGGALLYAAARRMLARGQSPRAVAQLIAGVDSDPRAIALARETLSGLLAGEMPELVCQDALTDAPAVRPGELVVANPPWIRFADLPRETREATRPLWQRYGLFSLSGAAARLGGGDKDLALLFTLVAADRYLSPGGRLAVLITLEALKAKGAGEGFRRFVLPGGEPLRPVAAHDLRALRAFPGAAGKPAILVLDRDAAPTWPVPFFVHRREGTARELPARPAGDRTGAPWQVGDAVALRRPGDDAPCYRARMGARVEPYGVYWLRVLERDARAHRLVVENVPELGKRPIQRVRAELEDIFARPALRGRDVRAGEARPELFALLVQDPVRRAPIPRARLAAEAPLTLAYLTRFADILLARGSRPVRELALRTEFYAQYGVGEYTLAPHQVVWNRMGNTLRAAVSAPPVLATDTCCLIACEHADEAHFLAALLNSRPVAEALACASDPGRGFASPGAIDLLALPRFDASDARHLAIARGNQEPIESLFRDRDARRAPSLTTACR